MNSTTIDLTGQKFGKLTVLRKGKGRYTSGGQYKTTWVCQCECGNVKEYDSAKLRSGHTLSCGCYRDEKVAKVNFEDLTGQRFTRLTVIRFLKPNERECKTRCWLCKCDCGNEVQVNASKLKTGHTKSCGCLLNKHIENLNKKYAFSNKRLYSIYKAMLERCLNSQCKKFKDYGGRGIKVCQEWSESYDAFAQWALNNGYDPLAKRGECTLDRIDVNSNYEPSNCRWITNAEQQLNRRNNRIIEYKGISLTVKEWSEKLKIPERLMRNHLQMGKSLDEIIQFFNEKESR
mgnify:CR=1 FL=1